MPKTFRTAKLYQWIIYILTPALTAVFIYLDIEAFQAGDFSWGEHWVLPILSIPMITLFVLGFLEAAFGKIVMDGDVLTKYAIAYKRVVHGSEILSYIENDKYIIVKLKGRRKLWIGKTTRGYHYIIGWLNQYSHNSDRVAAFEEFHTAMNDIEVGFNEDERQNKLNQAKRIAKAINIIGILLSVWAFAYPEPYLLVLSLISFYPILVMVIIKQSKGLITLDEKQGSKLPNVMFGLLIPTIVSSIRAAMDFEIIETTYFYILLATFIVFCFTILLYNQKEFTFKKAGDYIIGFGLIFISTAYSYGLIHTLNCAYDGSSAKKYTVILLDKSISKGKRTSYYLKLSKWEHVQEDEKISVSKSEYEHANIGDSLQINYYSGLLEIGWFELNLE